MQGEVLTKLHVHLDGLENDKEKDTSYIIINQWISLFGFFLDTVISNVKNGHIPPKWLHPPIETTGDPKQF